MSVTVFNAADQPSEIHLEAQGSLIAVAHRTHVSQRPGGGPRGDVTEFSKASRLRLLRQIARLAQCRTTFITFTYPDQYPDTMTAKSHLRAFLERVRRRLPETSGIWRLEYQKRGAPHFHLLMFNLPYIDHATLTGWWKEIIGVIDSVTVYVRVELVRSWRGVMSYAAKYLAKVEDVHLGEAPLFNDDAYLHAGRWWGVFNRACLPVPAKCYIVVKSGTGRGFSNVKQVLRRFYPGVTKNRARGAAVFQENAYHIWACCLRLLLDDVPHQMADPDLIQIRR